MRNSPAEKQPPEAFYKKKAALKNFATFRPAILLKKTPTQVFSFEYHEYFKEHLQTVVSALPKTGSMKNAMLNISTL